MPNVSVVRRLSFQAWDSQSPAQARRQAGHADVDALGAGQDGGGQVGGELEQGGGPSPAGLDPRWRSRSAIRNALRAARGGRRGTAMASRVAADGGVAESVSTCWRMSVSSGAAMRISSRPSRSVTCWSVIWTSSTVSSLMVAAVWA